MDTLCFATNMTSSEWASWVQAIGSILAIGAAAGIAIWQSRQQHKSAVELRRQEFRHASLESAKTLLKLATNCAKMAEYFVQQLASRDAVHQIGSGERHLNLEELRALQNWVSGIPVYQLPDVLVSPAMALESLIRQLNQAIEAALRAHRNMDAADFERFFNHLGKFSNDLALTRGDIELELGRLSKNA